jgi:regulator of RNase E activity RraA
MNSAPAIRSGPDFERVSAELIERARSFPTTILADVSGCSCTLNARVQALSPLMRVAGPALTVEVRPGDNLMLHAALAIAQPGDVIIVDGKGDLTAALCGEIMALQAQATGIAGFVVDAAVRDSNELMQGTFPVFAAGTNPCGPTKMLCGRVNWPASVAGVAVCPGDLVVGDADGVVVIPREDVPAVLERAQKKADAEELRKAAIRAGDVRPKWLNAALHSAGAFAEGQTL